MNKKTIRDLDLKGKRVLMRVDFNVPIKDGKVADDTRITAALPSIKYCLEKGASVVLMSHLGRPKGKGFEAEFSLKPVAGRLSELIKKPVAFAPRHFHLVHQPSGGAGAFLQLGELAAQGGLFQPEIAGRSAERLERNHRRRQVGRQQHADDGAHGHARVLDGHAR